MKNRHIIITIILLLVLNPAVASEQFSPYDPRSNTHKDICPPKSDDCENAIEADLISQNSNFVSRQGDTLTLQYYGQPIATLTDNHCGDCDAAAAYRFAGSTPGGWLVRLSGYEFFGYFLYHQNTDGTYRQIQLDGYPLFSRDATRFAVIGSQEPGAYLSLYWRTENGPILEWQESLKSLDPSLPDYLSYTDADWRGEEEFRFTPVSEQGANNFIKHQPILVRHQIPWVKVP